ncbi:MAG TPA: bifunctional Delta(1)-pyrroline-2-carboxylate/Delta(1)-piperideine-2-carboxylate reductase [Burkholderiaceae bacterium]|nr:bifunctional Delta(1)-pyrroline-2-carboxylate/Delta(1)-piperideine-2-carboxylate reductase [Burkholderiaceae bacterium]
MSDNALAVFDAQRTAELLAFPALVETLRDTVADHARGAILAPERQVLPFPQGGFMLSMPATAQDIGIHKLVNVVPANKALGLPTIHGVVSAYDGATGRPLLVLDGPTVTARRTAAISMLGIQAFRPAPACIALIGTGTQAGGHAEALAALFPGLRTAIIGRSRDGADAFVTDHRHLDLALFAADQVPTNADVVITLTTSASPVYTDAAHDGRLVIGVGAYKHDLAEIGPLTLAGSDIYVDDEAGARHEAGDLIQAGVDWQRVRPLAQALTAPPPARPVVFKTVGCAAWDLAAARCALAALHT